MHNEGFHFCNVVGFFSESFLVKFCGVNRVLCAENLSEVPRLFSFEKPQPVDSGCKSGWIFQLDAVTLHSAEEDT